MKIGTFAKKFNLNVSTVRFYVNNGLLTPAREGGHYEFGSECVSDMKNILKYKKYQFSLEEIQLLFFMEKASGFQDEIVIEVCADILKKKRDQLILERDNLTGFIHDLDHEIENLSLCESGDNKEEGVPFSYIPYLFCPDCQKPLNIDSASLANGSIQKGNLWCDCGYKVAISEGILLCQGYQEETPFKAFDNIDSVISMKEQFSTNYRMLIKKAYIWMHNSVAINPVDTNHVMAGPFTLNFIFEYIEKLGPENIYIIFDPSLSRIKKIKRYLSGRKYKMVYIVGKPDDLPVKRESVDLFIDDYSTVNSLFTYNKFYTDAIGPILKPGGEVIGIFSTYQQAPLSLRNFKIQHPDFEPRKMNIGSLKQEWGTEGVQLITDKKIGATGPGEKHFPQNEPGETVEVHGYYARKSMGKKK